MARGGFSLFGRENDQRETKFTSRAIFVHALSLFLGVQCVLLFSIPAPRAEVGGIYRVTGDRVNLRSGPGTSFKIVGRVRLGDYVVEAERSGDWIHGFLLEGSVQQAWMHGDYLKPTGYNVANPSVSGAIHLYDAGVEAANTEDYSVAAEKFKAAISLWEEFPHAHYNLALAYHRMGKYREATEAAERAFGLYPTHKGTLELLATTYSRKQEYDEAAKIIQAGLKYYPGNRTLLFVAIYVALNNENLEKAESTLSTFQRNFPDDPLLPQVQKDVSTFKSRVLARGPTSSSEPPASPSSAAYGSRWLAWLVGFPLYVIGGIVVQFILNLLLGLLNMLGLGIAAGPGLGGKWLKQKFGFEPEAVEKVNLGLYVFTWAGPIYLFVNAILIAIQASAITVYTGLFNHWFPAAQVGFGILAILWIYSTIGFSGLALYWIILWLLRYWLGTLGIFWSVVGTFL